MAESGPLRYEQYHTHFDPDAYIKTYYSVLDGSVIGGAIPFILERQQDIFKAGDVKGKRLLDIGTGPIPQSVISAVPFVQDIYLTEFSASNRKYLHDALFGSGKQDYSNIFKFVTDLSDKSQPWTKLSEELKGKVRGIFPCDLLKDDIFAGSYFPLFDVITTSFCMDAAPPDVDTYGKLVKKVSKYIKLGGHLVYVGVLDESFYFVGEEKFYALNISADEVKAFWKDCGFSIQSWDEIKGSPECEDTDFGSVFVMHCIKES
ncbi:hypothetical protein SNE40_004083 [Patella caerulea]|uniref:Uncharacterized protein n=1 Tax=Patella caerulea TaxID=87958 RepID=A0AAN8K991_PATCE